MKIIIVDPFSDDLEELKEMLQDLCPGDTVRSFDNPMAASRFIYEKPPDILFVEADMRPMDGFEFIKTFRVRYPGVKAVIVNGDKRLRRRITTGEADAFLQKTLFVDMFRAVALLMGREPPIYCGVQNSIARQLILGGYCND